MPEFPIILLPAAITRIQSELPLIPAPLQPKAPEDPITLKPLRAEPKRIVWSTVFVITAIIATIFLAIAVVVIPNQALPLAVLSIPGGGICGVISQLSSFPDRQRDYERDKQEHNVQFSKYKKALERLPALKQQYQEALTAHQQKCELMKEEHHTPEKIAKYRRDQCLLVLRKTKPPDGKDSEAKQGASEAGFAKVLEQFFSGKIHPGQTLDIPGCQYPYTADFAYIDRASGLHIDIEIDEPYVYQSGEPIHYIGKDDQRNDFFLQKGWLVIRFSEEQVVRYPQRCCKTIATLIAKVAGDSSRANQFRTVQDLKPIRQWTYDEALHMAANGTREKYRLGGLSFPRISHKKRSHI